MLNCKLCESSIGRTHQILLLKDMLPKFMRIQRFYCKLCENNFAKGNWMKGHIISVHVETNNFI